MGIKLWIQQHATRVPLMGATLGVVGGSGLAAHGLHDGFMPLAVPLAIGALSAIGILDARMRQHNEKLSRESMTMECQKMLTSISLISAGDVTRKERARLYAQVVGSWSTGTTESIKLRDGKGSIEDKTTNR